MAFFSLNLMGGGDAKLAAATAFWLGWENLLPYGFLASLVGFLLAIVIIYMRFSTLPRYFLFFDFLARLADKGVPYGVALSLGGLLIYPQTEIWNYLSV